MTSSIKILHIQLLPLLSGVQRVSLNEINEVTDKYPSDFEYSLVCSYEGPLTQELSKSKISYFTVPQLKRNISPSSDLKALYSLYKIIKANSFDVVHTHSSKTGLLGRVAAKCSGTKRIIHTVHGFSFPASKNKLSKFIFYFMEWLAKFCTHELLVLNKTDYNIATKQLRYDPDSVTLVPNGINTEKFAPNDNINLNLRIVMVGRLWEQKNPMCLAKAAKLLTDKYNDIEIDFIGDGELRNNLQDYIVKHNLSDKVKILGWSSSVESLLPYYDVFVLPSLWEGMPLAILEAQACGLPAVVSNIPGNSDLIENGVNGYLFEKNNSIELFRQIEKIYLDDGLRRQLSLNAREIVCNKYSCQIRNRIVTDLYVK